MPLVTVMAHGCFDCFHYGHLQHLRQARALGDRLVIALTADAYVNKGPGRPVFDWNERMRMLGALRMVDAVYQVNSAEHALDLIRPQIYVKGEEYEGKLPEYELCDRYGTRVVFVRSFPVYSSTKILTGEMLRERVEAVAASRK